MTWFQLCSKAHVLNFISINNEKLCAVATEKQMEEIGINRSHNLEKKVITRFLLLRKVHFTWSRHIYRLLMFEFNPYQWIGVQAALSTWKPFTSFNTFFFLIHFSFIWNCLFGMFKHFAKRSVNYCIIKKNLCQVKKHRTILINFLNFY